MQLLLQGMDRGATAGRLDRLRGLDRGRGDGGARRRDNVPDRPRRQDAVDGEERRGRRHGGGGAARSRGDLARVPVPRRIPRATDRTPGEGPVLPRGVGRLARVAPRRRRRRDVILITRVRRVAVQIAVVVAVAGYTGTIVQRTRRLRHGRA